MTYIKQFTEITKTDAAIAGGKGASLGEMIQNNIPVPPGFVVVSQAFDTFIKETNLFVEIDAVLDEVNIDAMHTIELASKKIQAMILAKEIPENISKDILHNFTQLNSEFVAVRSSATAEDSVSAAWAGQLDTFLNTTKDNLLENVKKCWASLFTPRAIFYRFEKKLNKDHISVAVVIQTMVQSETSGVIFSVHPVTEDYNHIIIEAGFGLGEAIVSGQVTPDSYVVDKQGFEILDITVQEQQKGLFKHNTEGNEWKDLGEQGKNQVLSGKDIVALAKHAVQIENHYGFPCDIEWAKEGDNFYITQSRPITTLSHVEPKEKTLAKAFKERIGNEELLVVRGKFFPLFLLTGWLKFYDEEFIEKEDIYPVFSTKKNDKFSHYVSLDKYLEISKKGLKRYIKNQQYKENVTKKYNKIKSEINVFYTSYFEKKSQSESELLSILKKSEELLHDLVAYTLFIEFLDEDVVKKTYTEAGLSLNFEKIFTVSEICDFPSFDIKNNMEIIREGKKNPEYLKHVYTGYSAAPTKEEVEEKIAKINLDELKEEIVLFQQEIAKKSEKKKKLREGLNNDEKNVADFLGWITELRDDRKPLMNKLGVLFNETIRALYRKWGIEENLSLVSYTFDVLKGKVFVLENLSNLKKRQNNFVNLYYGDTEYSEKYEDLEEEFKEAKTLERIRDGARSIKGQVASKGKVTGIARVIYDPKRFHSFEEGDILVTSMTRPQFVPIMRKASAIVTNEGGIACHAAIVSRELKKPCVIGTKYATEIIRDGDEIEVDANTGVVKVLS